MRETLHSWLSGTALAGRGDCTSRKPGGYARSAELHRLPAIGARPGDGLALGGAEGEDARLEVVGGHQHLERELGAVEGVRLVGEEVARLQGHSGRARRGLGIEKPRRQRGGARWLAGR